MLYLVVELLGSTAPAAGLWIDAVGIDGELDEEHYHTSDHYRQRNCHCVCACVHIRDAFLMCHYTVKPSFFTTLDSSHHWEMQFGLL